MLLGGCAKTGIMVEASWECFKLERKQEQTLAEEWSDGVTITVNSCFKKPFVGHEFKKEVQVYSDNDFIWSLSVLFNILGSFQHK